MEDMKFDATIHFDRKIEECTLWVGEYDHENELVKELDNLPLDKPMLLMRKNPDTIADEAVIVTPKVIKFLKSMEDPDDVNFDLYINYSITDGYKSKDHDYDHEEYFCKETPFISEDEFIDSERYWIEYEPSEGDIKFTDNILDAIKDFHNHKWHNGEKFWK